MNESGEIDIHPDVRNLGVYIAGLQGNGKSSLIQYMAKKDIEDGYGVTIIDPGHDLIDDVAHHIPKHRAYDTIYFDSADPIPIDFFSCETPREQQLLVNGIVANWGLETTRRLKPKLRSILNTLIEANHDPAMPDCERCTLLDVKYFLVDRERRATILPYAFPHRRKEWAWLDKLKTPEVEFEGILTRIGDYIEQETVQAIFEAKRPKLKIEDVINNNKIFLVYLREDPTDWFIGSLIMAKIRQVFFARLDIDRADRQPYSLYIDECSVVLQETPKTFEALLLRARKLNLWLTLANPIPSDLGKLLPKVKTIQNLILLKSDPDESHIFKSRIQPFTPEYLVSLPRFKGLLTTENKTYPIDTPEPLGFSDASYAQAIKDNTLTQYTADPITHTCGTAEILLNGINGRSSNESERDQNIPPDDPKKLNRVSTEHPQKRGRRPSS